MNLEEILALDDGCAGCPVCEPRLSRRRRHGLPGREVRRALDQGHHPRPRLQPVIKPAARR